ncbi:Colicin V production protein [Xanthobacter versatilis]|uniref:Colicin V production protein n=1 Tax=Xanthobacter autotrophicus (strain ATCC BAA-1158 / Py2) TaxID=78245 RepID=A7II00_XANP2|nr:Colicin V production protein [Xanthobacter autotrophicus Py2]
MPVTLLDIIVLTVMLISGLLAMVRGFLREVFSILSWVVAAGVTVYFQKQLLPVVKQYIAQDTAALAVTVAVLFLGTLLLATIITARISDVVLDSRIGALDRTLGFMFGLARGLLLMVIAMLFFNWLVPPEKLPPWVANAKSLPAIKSAGEWLKAQLPDDPENTILNKLKKPPAGEEGDTPAAPAAPTGGQRSDLGGTTRPAGSADASVAGVKSYRPTERQGLDQLVASTRGTGQ